VIGAAAPHLNVARIKNFEINHPPRAEQDGIVTAVRKATQYPNAAIQKARDEIALLREYRTRLIADVVTGKLDVREAATRLPDEADVPGSLDEAEFGSEAEEALVDDAGEVPKEAEA